MIIETEPIAHPRTPSHTLAHPRTPSHTLTQPSHNPHTPHRPRWDEAGLLAAAEDETGWLAPALQRATGLKQLAGADLASLLAQSLPYEMQAATVCNRGCNRMC